MNVFAPYAAHFDMATAGNNLFLDQVIEQRANPGIESMLLGHNGDLYNSYVSVMRQRPTIQLSTDAIALMLATNSAAFLFNGFKIDSDVDNDGLKIWFRKREEGGTFATTGHKKLTMASGLVFPSGLSVEHGGNAQLDLTAIATYDGANNPLAVATAALDTDTATKQVFTLGPAVVNGTNLGSVQGWSIQPGVQPLQLGHNGDIFDTFTALQQVQPVLTIRTTDMGYFDTYADGVAISSSVVLYLRKRTEGGGLAADDSGTHISLTATEGLITAREATGSHAGGAPICELQVELTKPAGAIMTVSTTANLP